MATKNEIASCFSELNITASDVVLEKCVELCSKYNIEAEDFCDQWYAYTASHLNGVAPTVEHLEKLERKEFQKSNQTYKRTVSTPKTATHIVQDGEATFMVNSYTATTPKSLRERNQQTPQQLNKKSISAVDNVGNSYASSPSVSQSEKYTNRSDSRSVQCYYGAPSAKYSREKDCNVIIKNANEGRCLDTNFKYMYQVMTKTAMCINNMTQWLGHAILEKHGLTLTEGILKNFVGDMVTYGRIVSDSDGKINAQSVLLEGSLETNLGYTVNLNLNKISKYSLFPGQVVAVQGNNPNSHTFIAEKIFAETSLPLPLDPPIVDEQLQIVVASGPYTLQSSLMFDPLKDLLKYVSEYKPHVLILIGPFLERNHESILAGGVMQTFDSFFEELVENIMNSLKDMNIQVIIVSSQNEAHHHPIYPTPPYNIRDKYNNLAFFPDPCMININGLVIGATSADILFHMGHFEIYQDRQTVGSSDRMGRLVHHLFNQRSFYPLYPPHNGIYIDHELFEQFGVMGCKPHVLILPSNYRHFIKNIEGCVVVNPERLTKGNVAGTFARIAVSPGNSQSVCNRTTCEIVRV